VANIKSAGKRARQAEERRQHNQAQRSMMRTEVKRVKRAINEKDKIAAEAAFKSAAPLLDRMAGKGLVQHNKAARYKSRLNAHIKGLSA